MKPLNKPETSLSNRLPMKKVYLNGFFCVLVLAVLYLITHYDSVERTYFYPFPYQKIVEKYSEKYNVDVDLIASVINKESKFKSNAKSHRGAVGLMQIMPETAEWIAGILGEKNFTPDKLLDPEVNIRFGVFYLSSLQDEFKKNEYLVLAAYNAGHGHVDEWMHEYGWDYDFDKIEEIPFKETKQYVYDVIKGKAKYKKLYP